MQRERTDASTPENRTPTRLPEIRPEQDAASLARAAAARAAETAAAPLGIALSVRTTATSSAGAVQMLATPDTSVREVMEESCRQLGLRDATRYVLIARGEVLEGTRHIGEIEGIESALTMRLVRRPEAGRA